MQTKAEQKKSQFALRMLETIEEVKSKYSQKVPNDNVSIVDDIQSDDNPFADKIRSCKKLLGIGGTTVHSNTLIKIDELKVKFNQISVDDFKKSFNRRKNSSLENIRQTLEELDVKGYNDILYSLESNDFNFQKNYDLIGEGTVRLEKWMLRYYMRMIGTSDRFGKLRSWTCKIFENHKNEVLNEVKTISTKYHLNFKIKKLTNVIETIVKYNEKRNKTDSFVQIMGRVKLINIIYAYFQGVNLVHLIEIKQFSMIYKINIVLNKISNIVTKNYKRTLFKALQSNTAVSKGLQLLITILRDTDKYNIKVGFTQFVYFTKNINKEEDRIETPKPVIEASIFNNTNLLLATTNNNGGMSRKFFSKRNSEEQEVKKSKSLNAPMNSEKKSGTKKEVLLTTLGREYLDKNMTEAINDFRLTDTLISEPSFRNQNSPETNKNLHLPYLVESRIIHTKSELKQRDDQAYDYINSMAQLQKNDSMSKIDINSCMKESVPDSEFIKYCELIFNSKKIHYNFSLDNIDIFRGSRQKTENEIDRYDSTSFIENSPNFRDIDQLMQFARKMNNSYELKDQTLDFLKSVDMDNKQRNSIKDPISDLSIQKKESINLMEDSSPITRTDLQSADIQSPESKSSMLQLMELPIEEAIKTFIPIIMAKNSIDMMKERRELTAIKEESTLIDKSNLTGSRNNSNMIESRDLLNSFKRYNENKNSGLQKEIKQNHSEISRRLKISPKNSYLGRNSSKSSQMIKHIESLKSDFHRDSLVEKESYATSDSSDINSSDISENDSNEGEEEAPNKVATEMNKISQVKNIDNKRASFHEKLNLQVNYPKTIKRPNSVSKPGSNFNIKKWNESFKLAALQVKNVNKVYTEIRSEVKGPLKKKKLFPVHGSNAPVISRLKTDYIEKKPITRKFSKTVKAQPSIPHTSIIQPILNFTNVKAKPYTSIKQIKSTEEDTKFGVHAVREQSTYKRKVEQTSNKKLTTPNVNRSPVPLLQNGKMLGFEKQRSKSNTKANNFIDKNKKIAFENNIAKYFPKTNERRPCNDEKAKSFNISGLEQDSKPTINRVFSLECTKKSRLSRAQSVQYRSSQKSFFSSSMVLNKENGLDLNNNIKKTQNITQNFVKMSINDVSVKRKPNISRAESIKVERSKLLQRRADCKFFDVN